jgi:hypothetical protein
MSTPLLRDLYELYSPITVIVCVASENENEQILCCHFCAYLQSASLILFAEHLWTKKWFFGAVSSLLFCCASAVRVSKCVIFVLYICCSELPSCKYSWRAPIFMGDGVISSLSLNLVLPSICRFLIYFACCNPDCNFNILRTKL